MFDGYQIAVIYFILAPRYQIAAWCKSSVRQIGLKLRIQTHTELSILLSDEVVNIGRERHLDLPP